MKDLVMTSHGRGLFLTSTRAHPVPTAGGRGCGRAKQSHNCRIVQRKRPRSCHVAAHCATDCREQGAAAPPLPAPTPSFLRMKSPSIGGEKEGLLEEEASVTAPPKKQGLLERGDFLKYGSLGFLILQNSSHVLLLRYSRVVGGECSQYVVSAWPALRGADAALSLPALPRPPPSSGGRRLSGCCPTTLRRADLGRRALLGALQNRILSAGPYVRREGSARRSLAPRYRHLAGGAASSAAFGSLCAPLGAARDRRG